MESKGIKWLSTSFDSLEWAPQLGWTLDGDPWLGALHKFPTVLHGRASFLYDMSRGSLQKCILSSLESLQRTPRTREITVADRAGYSKGEVVFKIGIGNGDGFDTLDPKERERILERIENGGPLGIIDLTFHLRYLIDDGVRHRIHEDHYVVRLVFQPARVEVLIHHLKGIRRIEPDELVRVVVAELNVELGRNGYGVLELESVQST